MTEQNGQGDGQGQSQGTDDGQGQSQQQQGGQGSQGQQQKPPWGSDDQFDAQRAWNLIQGVRGDLDKIKSERDDLRTKVQEHEDATKSDTEKLADAKDQATREAADARSEAARLRVAIKYGLDEDDLDFLGSGDPEQIEERAKRLAERLKPNGDDGGHTARRLPRERLRPGAAPTATEDDDDMNKRIRRQAGRT